MKFAKLVSLCENKIMASKRIALDTSLPHVSFKDAELTDVMRKNMQAIEKLAGVTFHTLYSEFGNFVSSKFWAVGTAKNGEVVVFTKQAPRSMMNNTLYSVTYGLEKVSNIQNRENVIGDDGKHTITKSLCGDIRYRDKATKQLDREDGPAIIYSRGTQVYYKQGELHRLDGPAIESSDGRDNMYYINGAFYTKERYESIVRNIDKENIKDVLGLGELF